MVTIEEGCGYPNASLWPFSSLLDLVSGSWIAGGLRSYRQNLNSAHTCVGKPPNVTVHTFFEIILIFIDTDLFFSKILDTNKYVSRKKFPLPNDLPFSFFHQQLHRTWHFVENFAASFCALNFIGAVRFAISDCQPALL